MFRRSTNSTVHDLGRALIGLGLMLLALHQMLGILAGVENAPEFRAAIGIVAAVPALAFVFAALAAWGVHSSVAIVLLIISLATSGALPLDAAFIAGARRQSRHRHQPAARSWRARRPRRGACRSATSSTASPASPSRCSPSAR